MPETSTTSRRPLVALFAGLLLGAPVGYAVHWAHYGPDIVWTEPNPPAFAEINARMHHGMTFQSSGVMDRDFARGMIAHHQGAVEMARAELAKGRDPEMRALAEEIVYAQEKEIALMRRWAAKNGGAARGMGQPASEHSHH